MKNEFYIFKINKEQTHNNGAYKYRYYIGDKELNKKEFIKELNYIIKENNKNYYSELYNVYNGDYIKHYKNGYYDLLLSYKNVLDELKNGGVTYNFNIMNQYNVKVTGFKNNNKEYKNKKIINYGSELKWN